MSDTDMWLNFVYSKLNYTVCIYPHVLNEVMTHFIDDFVYNLNVYITHLNTTVVSD